jgi:hypothetical protein
MSDARIEPFKGMVDCGPPPDPARLNRTHAKRARLPFGKRAPLLDLAMFPLPFSKIPQRIKPR